MRAYGDSLKIIEAGVPTWSL